MLTVIASAAQAIWMKLETEV